MPDAGPILIVDGNAPMTTMLRRFLERHQVQVRVAMGVAEAQGMLNQYLFSVVLTDLFLPQRDGLALLRHIRQTAPGVRVVIMAAFGSVEMSQHALAEGAYACLKKPFSLQRLWDLVQQAMRDDVVLYSPQ
jgi:DNA-binding NtrC family response regulator